MFWRIELCIFYWANYHDDVFTRAGTIHSESFFRSRHVACTRRTVDSLLAFRPRYQNEMSRTPIDCSNDNNLKLFVHMASVIL